ncbi:acetylornithine deacetylase [Bordetella trematum]|uniref:Probable succinyl-diaminopimelate desuccinylase n=3 Tax=Bordetella trematum TaxID=123899 RepID=A0A157SG63_9BORD|nr:ArgE/DapE family deacylase [Bordetella trematum]AZR92774.1 acetylornithine deacetylase [Bordetella trematum]NNH18016.1 ArgE/DapE family deacylase [Bordetella trematum]QIM71386.1 ArgE/DapE family deacylase [Bordetella trematum]SAI30613.1 acetylornithine deacetylase [Bordetella trematum]SAI46251.1 acetylornithine deacetylase [Bordetella trematum]
MNAEQGSTVTSDQIAAAVRELRGYMVQTLGEFVQRRSLPGQETPAAEYLEQALADLGLSSERIMLRTEELKNLPLFSPPCCPDGGRYNVLARHEPATGAGKAVLFNGHLDVVPTGPHELWSEGPFEGKEHEGWVYGRGSGDMKAGLVCALAAFKALKNLGVQPAGAVGFNGVLEEENTGNGTLATVSALQSAISAAKLSAFDAVVIPEPTHERMMRSQLGVFWMFVDVVGRPAHAAYMTTGVNPVETGLRIVDALKALEAEWNLPENRHPAYREHDHPINFNLGQIHAGDWNSSVPSVCTLGMRIACYPDMSIEQAKEVVESRVRAVADGLADSDVQVTVRYEGFHAPGCEYDLEVPAMRALAQAHLAATGELPGHNAATATTDARHFRLMMDVPVTCYGPKARNVHGFDECVSVDSMINVATTLALFMQQWCGLEPSSQA